MSDLYLNKALEAKGNKELMAKITFALAKTNSCHDIEWNDSRNGYNLILCENHKDYFKSLKDNYSNTNYYKEVLRECSWFLAYK